MSPLALIATVWIGKATAAAVPLLASRQIPGAVASGLLGGASLGANLRPAGIYTQHLAASQDLGDHGTRRPCS